MKITTASDWSTVNLELSVEEHGQFIMILGYAAGSIRAGDDDIRRMCYAFITAMGIASVAAMDRNAQGGGPVPR